MFLFHSFKVNVNILNCYVSNSKNVYIELNLPSAHTCTVIRGRYKMIHVHCFVSLKYTIWKVSVCSEHTFFQNEMNGKHQV